MISNSRPIKNVSDAVKYYFSDQERYYFTGVAPGRWFGDAANWLNLPDTVDSLTFSQLLRGFAPDGGELVQNAGSGERDNGWDFTFSPPKPVAVLREMASPEVRKVLDMCIRQSVQKTLLKLQSDYGVTRRGKGGKRHERAGMLFACFDDYVSRDMDMDTHTHCVIVNMAVRPDGTTGALHSVDFFRARTALGAGFDAELAASLRTHLGVEIEPAKSGFEISGISQSVNRHFSKRRIAIEEEMSRTGATGPLEAKKAALSTRPDKQEASLSELRTRWHQEGAALGFGPDQAEELIRSRQQYREKPTAALDLNAVLARLPVEKRTQETVLQTIRAEAIRVGADAAAFWDCWSTAQRNLGNSPYWKESKASEKTQKPGVASEQAQAGGASDFAGTSQQSGRPEVKVGSAGAQQAGATRKPKVDQAQRKPQSKTNASKSNPKNQARPQNSAGNGSQSDQGKASAKSQSKSYSKRHENKSENGRTAGKQSEASASRESQQKTRREQEKAKQEKTKRDKARAQQKRRNRRFRRAFVRATETIFPEKQTLEYLTRTAYALAKRYGPDHETLNSVLESIKPRSEEGFIHSEASRPFRHSFIPGLRWFRVPHFALGDQPRKWGQIRWRKEYCLKTHVFEKDGLFTSAGDKLKFFSLEIRVQDKKLFQDGGRWALWHAPSYRAVRIIFHAVQFEEGAPLDSKKKPSSTEKPSAEKSTAEKTASSDQSKDDSCEHSQ